MGTLTAGLDATLDALIANERRSARRTGEFLDRLNQGLKDLKSSTPPARPQLPPASAAAFNAMTDAALKQLLKAAGVKGYTTAKGKRLRKADRVALCVEHKLQPLTYDFLLAFYIEHTT